MLKGTNTGISLQQPASMDSGKMAPPAGLPAPSTTNGQNRFVKKEDLENAVNTAVANVMSKLETLILTSLTMP